MTIDPAFPTDASTLGADWYTAVLREGGAIGDGTTVVDAQAEPIGVGVGVLGLLWRVRLAYEGGAGPASVVVKLPAAAPQTRELTAAFRFYLRETRFYEEGAVRTPLATAGCHHSAYDEATGAFVLVLEDIQGRRTVDQLAGCSAEDAEVAVQALAGHHAAFWDDPSLSTLPWVFKVSDPPNPQALVPALRGSWPVIEGSFSHLLPGPLLDFAGKRFPDGVAALMDEMSDDPLTLLHGDFRLDNLCFATDASSPPVLALDWQICGAGRGPFDVAYFLSQSVRPEVRKAEEEGLLRRYHDTLQARGIAGYDWDQCWLDYRKGVLFCLAYPLNAGNVDLANDRAVELFSAMLDRSARAVVDLDAMELLPG